MFAAISDGLYGTVGKIFAYSIVHGGPLPSFLSKHLYITVAHDMMRAQPSVCDVPDQRRQQQLNEVRVCCYYYYGSTELLCYYT